MSIKSRWTVAIATSAIILLALDSTALVTAEPSQQNPTRTPTDEPTKAPYVFSTPVFIPTYTSATDLPPPRTPPTPRTPGAVIGEQTYTIEAGDNPSLIAKKVYGDAGKFRLIVEANNLVDSTRLRVGTVLIIPPLTAIAPNPAQPARTPTTLPQSTASIASADASLTPPPFSSQSAILTPTPPINQNTLSGGFAGLVEIGLRALSIIFLVGSLVVAYLAHLFYRNARRRVNASLIKSRLKGE